MMPLAEIVTIPDTSDDLRRWSFAHMANHRDIIRAVNTVPASGAAALATFVQLSPPNQDDYQLSGSDVTSGGTGYWQGASATWSANAGSNGWYQGGVPTIQLEFNTGNLIKVGFVPANSNPNAFYVTAAPNVGVLPTIEITGINNAVLTEYQLDPVDAGNLGLWLYQHQVMHQQMDLILGIAGQDLLGLDWDDPDQRSLWITLNADEHIQASARLGLG